MNIGLLDIDGHNFPNFALMKISAYHKAKGDSCGWAFPLMAPEYDRIYKSKIFTFTPDEGTAWPCEVVKGGTGYDISSKLPPEIEVSRLMDYSLYPQFDFSIQFFSRGCIRKCPFCLVRQKEGLIHAVEPVELNPTGKHIEVLDNNFFANPEWRFAVDYLLNTGQKINLHGVDIRIMDEEQAFYLNKLRLWRRIHIAWDLPEIDLTDKIKEVVRYIKPWKIMCYVLVGFNSTIEQDLYRIERLREFGITPFVMPFRDYEGRQQPSQYAKDLAQYVNKPQIFKTTTFEDFEPRRGFRCKKYLTSLKSYED